MLTVVNSRVVFCFIMMVFTTTMLRTTVTMIVFCTVAVVSMFLAMITMMMFYIIISMITVLGTVVLHTAMFCGFFSGWGSSVMFRASVNSLNMLVSINCFQLMLTLSSGPVTISDCLCVRTSSVMMSARSRSICYSQLKRNKQLYLMKCHLCVPMATKKITKAK